MAPQLIFGTAMFGMDYGTFHDAASISSLLTTLSASGIARLDTAARYPPTHPGQSETLIGHARPASDAFAIDTKTYTDVATDGSGDLTPAAVASSLTASLGRLGRERVHTVHAHRADPSTPVAEQARAFNAQIEAGRAVQWGVSNVPVEQLAELLKACDELGLRKPACYQGDYNVCTRGMESRLLPLLREHGIAFNAFRPLAGGFLTAKFLNNDAEGTRFGADSAIGPALATKVFGAADLHDAVRAFDAEARACGLAPVEVAMRWIAHHSALGDGDGVIVGASRPQQVVEAVEWVRKGPLPAEMVAAAERLWAAVEPSRKDII